ncbi:MAG: hypothetical protein ACKV2U_28510 [Bryobacteraceae bacterium]
MAKRLLTLMAIGALALSADPFLGTWKPNLATSKLRPDARERRKLEVITIESAGKSAYLETIRSTDGRAVDIPPLTLIVDGKERASADSTRGFRASRTERVDERHIRTTVKGPQGTSVYDRVVSRDGKTLTLTHKGKGSISGRAFSEVLVFGKW